MRVSKVDERKHALLKDLSFGQRIAEQEAEQLANYFVDTDQWRQLQAGAIDIIYGPKGAGKSALYSLLTSKVDELFDRGIIIVPAENPSGAPAFSVVKAEPPTSEYEFTGLWKLYFACLIARQLKEYGAQSPEARDLYAVLSGEGLFEQTRNLRTVLLGVMAYFKRISHPTALEAGVSVDPATGQPVFAGKITLGEPNDEQRGRGAVSVDLLLEKANAALEDIDLTMWLVLDRLDVAFEQSDELEHNALRALFKAYLDMGSLGNIGIKVFLRTDIWQRITDGGFREASHITKHLTITWHRQSLVNLVVRRILANPHLNQFYGLDPDEILASIAAQEALIERLFPAQVDLGSKKLLTFDWMLSRTQDGTKRTAPRELIHLLSCLRDVQMRHLEIGGGAPAGELLFDRAVFKEALKAVSEERLTKTLYAEYDALKPYVEKLRGEKTQHTLGTLASIWKTDETATRELADKLVGVGFFESQGTKDEPVYWIPFLYRDALGLIQGTAR